MGVRVREGRARNASWSSSAARPVGACRARPASSARRAIRETVALGMWSIDFYRSQGDRYGTDSGFRELGYLILATDEEQGARRWRASRCSAASASTSTTSTPRPSPR